MTYGLTTPIPRRRKISVAENDWSEAGIEPSVGELLSDPVVGLLMVTDALTPEDMQRVIDDARQQLLAAHCEMFTTVSD